MKVSVENLPSRQVVLTIEAEPAEVAKSRLEACRHLAERARIPGFRQGKAPPVMLERHLGKSVILQETIEHLVPEATDRAIKEQKIEAAGVPAIEVTSTEPIAWKATVPLAPVVELGAYKDVRVDAPAPEVKEEDIDKVVEQIRYQQAPWIPSLAPVSLGDLLTMDFYAEEGGRKVADDKGVQFQPQAEMHAPVPGFSEQLVGVNGGETKEFGLAFDKDSPLEHDGHEHTEFQGKSYHFRVTVHDIKKKELPALDDGFAKGVGEGYDSYQALRDHVRKQLMEQAQERAKDKLREDALEKAIAIATLEYPPSLVDHEVEHMLEDQERQTRGQVSLDEYLKSVGKTREQLLEEMKPAAVRRIQRSLVVTELRDKEGVAVSEQEIDDEVNRLASGSGAQEDQLRQVFASERGRRSIEQSLLTRKTLDRLVEIATQPATPQGAAQA